MHGVEERGPVLELLPAKLRIFVELMPSDCKFKASSHEDIQEYLAHKKTQPPWTLPLPVLGRPLTGERFLMNEVPLYHVSRRRAARWALAQASDLALGRSFTIPDSPLHVCFRVQEKLFSFTSCFVEVLEVP